MEKGNIRPPIVTVLGHVDHGKTTLLDAIRKSNIAAKEKGGITQSIGASVVTTKESKKITFIDTPGHAAFTKMRSRGANVADIAVLVVAGDDGVKPQTQEALQLIKEAKIPFIVAITKTDLPSANIESTKGQLEKEGVLFEGRGGDIPVVSVSAKESKGIDELLETISLVFEVHGLKSDLGEEEAVVIESSKDQRGPQAAVIVKNGNLKVGEQIYVEGQECKIRALFDASGSSVKEVEAGYPALVLGFVDTPPVGAKVLKKEGAGTGVLHKEERWTGKVKEDEIAVIIKAENQGALEALIASLPTKIVVIDSGVGDVNESDVLAAKSGNALIFAFRSRASAQVSKLAETEGVIIESFEIIYELIQRLEEILKEGIVEILGKAQILATFPFEKKKIAGCKIIEGKISKGDSLTLLRADKEIGKTKVVSLKKQKQEISEAKTGEEFGALLEPQLDFQIGDVLVSVRK